MNRRLLLALSLAAVAASSFAQQSGQQSGRRFDVGRFSAIELTGSDDVRVTSGAPAVSASGDPRALEALLVEVRGDTLHIGRRAGRWRDRGAVVSVSVPALRAAAIRGSGNLRVAHVAGAEFAGSVGGSGNLSLAHVEAARLRLAVGGSGSIVASGSAPSAAIDVGGSGNVDARALRTRDLVVAIGGSGSVVAVASGTATVSAGGSGSAVVTGGAQCTVSPSGSGSVRCG